jgi:putative ABC transport system permease protein
MLARYFHTPVTLGLSQAAVVTLLALAVMLVARRKSIHVERETLSSLVRGILQIVAVGLILIPVLKGPVALGFLAQAVMIATAAAIAARRAEGIPGAFGVSLAAITAGSAAIILPLVLLGVIEMRNHSLVPIGSMVIANAMTSCSQALERFRADVVSRTGPIEAALALGASPESAALPCVQGAVTAAFIPRIDTLRSLGIVWIPGMMAGMLLSGSDPVYAAIYQFVVIAMIYASSGIAAMTGVLLIRRRAFSPAEQLLLRPGKTPWRTVAS